jgi:hypothetical protein
MSPQDRIRAYLTTNKSRVEYSSSVDEVVRDVKQWVFFGFSPIPDSEIRQTVVEWAMIYAVRLLISPQTTGPAPSPTPTPPPNPQSELVESVKKAISTIGAGVTIGKRGTNVNLGVTGLTGNLKRGATSTSVAVSWTGALQLNAQNGPFHFSGTLSKDKWEMTLSFPEETYIPDLATLGKVFAEGERAMGKMVVATQGFTSLQDTGKIGALLKPHVAAVEEAVTAVSGIAKAPKQGGMSFGFRIGSPEPGPGEQGMPRGVQGSIVFTYVF